MPLTRKLEDGACMSLAPEVVDKFYNSRGRGFETMVAKAICQRCVCRPECIEAAVIVTRQQRHGIRGGVQPTELDAMHLRLVTEYLRPAELVDEVLNADELAIGGLQDAKKHYRRGDFPDSLPARPDLAARPAQVAQRTGVKHGE